MCLLEDLDMRDARSVDHKVESEGRKPEPDGIVITMVFVKT